MVRQGPSEPHGVHISTSMAAWNLCIKKSRHCCATVLLITVTLLLYGHSLLTVEWQPGTTDEEQRGQATCGDPGICGSHGNDSARGGRLESPVERASHKLLHDLSHNSSVSQPSKISYCKVPKVLPMKLKMRRKIAQEACVRLHNQLPKRWHRQLDHRPSPGLLSKLRWDRLHHLLYCHVPKVASTTWAWHLLRALGIQDEEIASSGNVHILLKKRLPPPKPQDYKKGFLDGTFKFIVTRHPFRRLVSAYKNKIVENTNQRYQYAALAQTIMKQYHTPNKSNLAVPTFRDFCHYVADTIETWLLNPQISSWPDHHWMPITYICSPCNLEYDVYSKMDTMDSDTRFIAKQCGLSHKIDPSMILNPSSLQENKANLMENGMKENTNLHIRSAIQGFKSRDELEVRNEHKKTKQSDDIKGTVLRKDTENKYAPESVTEKAKRQYLLQKSYADYISELSRQDLKRLYKIYKLDFEIFGYNFETISGEI